MKETICTAAGLVGGFITLKQHPASGSGIGGWDSALSTLVIFMGDSPHCGEMLSEAKQRGRGGKRLSVSM